MLVILFGKGFHKRQHEVMNGNWAMLHLMQHLRDTRVMRPILGSPVRLPTPFTPGR